MADGPITSISDVIVPEIFTEYMQQRTEEKSRLLASGAVIADPFLDGLLAGGGNTFHVPSFRDLDNDEENTSTDAAADQFTGGTNDSVPKKIQTAEETAVRLSRNQSWSSADLTAALAGRDPMGAIGDLAANYWVRREQANFVMTMRGVFADNAAAPTGIDNHDQDDLTVDISGTAYNAGVTSFSGEAMIDAFTTAGDSQEDLTMIMMHSGVYARAQKNNLIEFIPDSEGRAIKYFMGREVIVDDNMPANDGVYETWLFGAGAVRMGRGTPKVPTAVDRKEEAGNGGGQEILYSRRELILHPVGHAFVGTAPAGGPLPRTTTNNLGNAASWARVYPERKQIKMARLITREAAPAA